MIDIKDNTGEVLYSTLINNGSKRKFKLMKDDYITLKFTLDTPVAFPLGTYVECDFGRFEMVEEQSPTYKGTNGGYDYELKLEADYMKWRNKLFKYQPEVVGGNEASWSLTATLSMHMDIFLRCLKSWGYKYNGYDYDYFIDDSVTTENLFITYSNTNLIDALTMMAEAAGCEWWVEGAGVYLGRLESEKNPVTLKIGDNTVSMQLSKSSGDYFTRIFAFGGTSNISPRYRKKLLFSMELSSGGALFNLDKPLEIGYFRENLRERHVVQADVNYTEAATIVPGGSSDTVQFVMADRDLLGYTELEDWLIRGAEYKMDLSGLSFTFNATSIPCNFMDLKVRLGFDPAYPFYEQTIGINGQTQVDFKLGNVKFKATSGTKIYVTIFVNASPVNGVQQSSTIMAKGAVKFTSVEERVSTSFKFDGLEKEYLAELNFLFGSDEQNYEWRFDSDDVFEVDGIISGNPGIKISIDGLVTSNVPIGYFDSDVDGLTVNGVVQRRLMLPEGIPYVDVYDGMSDDEVIEGVVVFDYVFPGKTLSVSSVTMREIEQTEEDEEGNETPTGIKLPIYTIKTTGLTGFSQDCIIGDELTVTFQTGSLAGLTFGASFLPDESTETEAAFEIVANKDYGGRLPDEIMKPSQGDSTHEADSFVMSGYDTEYIFSNLTEEAEQRLYQEALKYKEKLKGNKGTVTATVMSDFAKGKYDDEGLLHPFSAGDRVTINNKSLFPQATTLRVIGYDLNLDIPFDTPVYTIGESPTYSRLGALESKIDSVSLNGSKYMSGVVAGTGSGTSIYVIKSKDSTSPKDTNVYSSLRTDAEISKAVSELSARLAEEFLSRLEPDTAHGLIKFMNGLHVGDAVDSMTAGRGILADVLGRIQAQRIEVRGSMTVMDLVINEIHAMAGDYSFTDSGAIDAVEDLGNGTYRLWLRKDTDYDVTSLDTNDIVYSIINNLKLGGTDYKTSWMRVVAKNVNNNTLTVLPYPDAEVPGGTNYPPQPGYNLTRRGNSTMPETGGTNERAQAWLLSSREGRIMFLANVYKPILEDYNYALTIGKLPDLKALERFAIPQGSIGITTQYMIAEKFFEFDYNGDVVPRHVERGAWSLAVAQGDKPYRNVSTTIPEAGGTTYTLLSRDVVTHSGCRWACLTDKTQLEPKWNSTGWEMIEGDSRYSLFFESSRGSSFFAGGVDTVLTAHVRFGQIDITDELMGMSATEVEWARDSGNESMDRSWNPTYDEGAANAIHLTDADMPPGFGSTVRTLAFICRVFIPVGEEPLSVEGRIGVSI